MHDVSMTNKYSNKQERLWLEYLLLIMEILIRACISDAVCTDEEHLTS